MIKDIAQLLISSAGKQLADAQIASKEKHVSYEIEECIQALILYQAAMEAIVNDEITNHPLLDVVRLEEQELHTRYKSLSFKNKWIHSYDALHIKEREYLDAYLEFYSHYRIPITHPKTRFIDVKKYRFAPVYRGIENGWYAHQLLYAVLGKELTSWDEFCQIHELRMLT